MQKASDLGIGRHGRPVGARQRDGADWVQCRCAVRPCQRGTRPELFVFRCVYDAFPAFLDVRKFAGADKLKRVIVWVSHHHDFSVFPSRMPRNAFDTGVLEQFNVMVSNGGSCYDIEMAHNVLCSKHVFQNAVRNVRADTRQDQARAIRDLAMTSRVWSSEIRLSADNVFVEAFFANSFFGGKEAVCEVRVCRRHFVFKRLFTASCLHAVSGLVKHDSLGGVGGLEEQDD